MEQIAYHNIATKAPLIVSDRTAMGSGKLGNVARIVDYYEVSDSDFEMAT